MSSVGVVVAVDGISACSSVGADGSMRDGTETVGITGTVRDDENTGG